MMEGRAETPEEKKARMRQPLKIVHTGKPQQKPWSPITPGRISSSDITKGEYLIVLSNLIVAQSNLIKNTQHTKAWPHYVALCKEIERVGGFTYAPFEED